MSLIIAASIAAHLPGAEDDLPESQADRFEVTATFQRGINGYDLARDTAVSATLRLVSSPASLPAEMIDPADAGDRRHLLLFQGLKDRVRGENIRIVAASLGLYYYDKTWSETTYTLCAHTSTHGSRESFAPEPVGTVDIHGDRSKDDVRTPLGQFVEVKLPPSLVQGWLADPSTNKGLVLRIGKPKDPPAKPKRGALYFFSNLHPVPALRPRLTVRYSFEGNVPPYRPVWHPKPASPVGPGCVFSWQPVDPPDANGDSVTFQMEYQHENSPWHRVAEGLKQPQCGWKRPHLAQRGSARVRVRAVDEHGAVSHWTVSEPLLLRKSDMVVWIAPPTQKIRPQTRPVTGPKSILIRAAKNETEPCQVVIWAAGELKDVRVTTPELASDTGEKLPPGCVTGYRQLYVSVDAPTSPGGRAGLWPDPLVPFVHPVTGKPTTGKYAAVPFDVPSGSNQPLWFDVAIPANTVAGIYRGAITISAADQPEERIDLTVEVLPFALPEDAFPVAAFRCTPEQVRRGHQLKEDNPAFAELMKRYDDALAAHHIHNWQPATFDPKRHALAVTVEDDNLTVDWTEFDRAMAASGSADTRHLVICPMWSPRPVHSSQKWTSADEKLMGLYFARLQTHLMEKGWLTRSRLMPVERPLSEKWTRSRFELLAGIARKHAPRLKIIAMEGYSPKIEELADSWALTFKQVMTVEKGRKDCFRRRRSAGRLDLWGLDIRSSSRTAAPSMLIDREAMHHRIWPWITWRLGLGGIISRHTAVYAAPSGKGPWEDPVAITSGSYRPAGYGRLFYPGTPGCIGSTVHVPIPSLRLKLLSEGLEDVACLELLRSLGPEGAKAAEAFAGRIVALTASPPKSFVHPRIIDVKTWPPCTWEADPGALSTVRKQIIAEILRELYGLKRE